MLRASFKYGSILETSAIKCMFSSARYSTLLVLVGLLVALSTLIETGKVL